MKKPAAALAAASLTSFAVIALTGCSAVDDLLSKSTVASYADAEALESSDALPAAAGWVPRDADGIELRRAIDAEAPDGVLTFTSGELDAAQCAEVQRRSAPSWGLDDAPDVYAFDTVWACGDWSAIPDGDGWLAWTPNSELERADAAKALASG